MQVRVAIKCRHISIHKHQENKLILLGEYAVLEGAPALVTAVDRYARVTLQPVAGEDFMVDAPVVGISSVPFHLRENGKLEFPDSVPPEAINKLNFFSAALTVVVGELKKIGLSLQPAKISIDTGDFFINGGKAKLGLGSSAAITISLLGALFQHGGKPVADENQYLRLFQLALEAHRIAQGNIGSGIDVAASAFGGLLQYRPDYSAAPKPEIKKIIFPDNLHFLIIWTGQSASTTELVGRVNAFREKDSAGFEGIMKEMSKVSSEGAGALASRRLAQFFGSIQAYYRLMDRLGQMSDAPIISPVHRRIAEIVCAGDAVYKPSGAGGGDLGIAFSDSQKALKTCAAQLQQAGFGIIDLNFVSNGFQIKVNVNGVN